MVLTRCLNFSSRFLNQWVKPRLSLRSLSSSLLITLAGLAVPLSAIAQEQVGVIRSRENVRQWDGIIQRLQAARINYCIVDLPELRPGSGLNQLGTQVDVLFLPNLETLDGTQVSALEGWLTRGGAVIVSGPTGSLSQPQVRSQLRSLLGAYWGFPLSNPSTIEPNASLNPQDRQRFERLSTTIQGGVIIPVGDNSRVLANWQANGTPPGVILTPNTTFIGWRWGVDTVAPFNVDALWLKNLLSRHGNFEAGSGVVPQPCGQEAIARPTNPERRSRVAEEAPDPRPETPPMTVQRPRPNNPRNNRPRPQNNPPRRRTNPVDDPITPRPPIDTQPTGKPIPANQYQAMQQELANLVGRYESALLMAQASDASQNISLGEAISQHRNRATNANPTEIKTQLSQARNALQSFSQLVQQQQYDQARAHWVQSRNFIWDNYPTDRTIQHPETRAMWLDRGTIVRAKSEADLAKVFNRLADAGINTVFFETVNASYTIYPSEVAPEQNPLTQGWDPLAAAVKLAHERGMELHAWVWIFAAANQRHNQILRQPNEYLGPVLTQNPHWAGTDREGNPFQRNTRKAFFDPANPEVQEYLRSLIDEIATKYDVDGVQLDYIRYPFQDARIDLTYGFGIAARQEFRRLRGVDPVTISPRDRLWRDWTLFRAQQVTNFVSSVSQMLKEKHPDVVLSAAVFPIPPQERLGRIQQNWETWVDQGYLDLLVPMSYASDTTEFEQLTSPLLDGALGSTTLFLPGIRLLSLPTVVAVDQMQHIRDSASGGYALFASENLSLNLQQILRRTQGRRNRNSQDPIAHRQPLKTAFTRYQTMQQEWSFLLMNDLLEMSDRTMQEWGKQAEALNVALEAAANDPSGSNTRRALSLLTNFQNKFPQWMQQSGVTPYQVRTWQNRLGALEMLVRYGGDN